MYKYRYFIRAACVSLGIFAIYETISIIGSDAQYVSSSCRLREFRCEGGSQCLPPNQVCDGTPQCVMKDDESLCNESSLSISCEADEIKCRFGGCLNSSKACDGQFDCPGGSDEAIETCVGARPVKPRPVVPEEFRNNYKIMQVKIVKEIRNPCRFHEFRCDDGGKCLKLVQVCDGKQDCIDGLDESGNDQWGCNVPSNSSKCGNDEFRCLLGGCVDKSKRCDGTADCWGSFDEDVIFCSSTRPYTIVPST